MAEACEADRIGDFIETASGRAFYPLDPRVEDVDIEDIATALSQQNRYSGHTRFPWSVAAHSLWVAELCPPSAKLWGLLHDAAEAYLVDLPRPLKRLPGFEAYGHVERLVMRVVCDRFGLPHEAPQIVERADRAMLWHEANALMSRPLKSWWEKWRPFADSFGDAVEVRVWQTSPGAARAAFLAAFRRYTEVAHA